MKLFQKLIAIPAIVSMRAGFVQGGCQEDEFDDFKVVNRVLNPEEANV